MLLALETLAVLDGGHLDLGKHEVVFAGPADEQGQRPGRHRRGRLAQLVEAGARGGRRIAGWRCGARSCSRARARRPPGGMARVAVDKVELSEIALAFDDQAGGQQAALAALGLKMSPSAEFGPAGTRIELAGTRLSLAEGRFSRGKDGLTLPEAVVAASTVSIALEEPGLALALVEPS